ncbi:BTB/POZ and MATH domain-containing protein 2 [Triticum urartu]|uniref:BTB/POZ and MATH domain-containing protein 2 n=1 Tax=Triticum urartu TaxID=4572 RepID=M7ZHC2_TRIUA|nr:BTB/POZ and MATH domain-containing protein 2 [Triticum urartu]
MSSQESDIVSASTISTTATTGGCHLLKIAGYSQSKQLRNGAKLRSCEFEAAGCSWCIVYYPRPLKNTEYVALALKLTTERVSQPINATVRLTLVPHHGKPAPATPHYLSHRSSFDHTGDFWFYPLITREELESSGYLVDDCFSVRCDIHVISTSAVADEVVQAHDLERMGLACACTDELCTRRHASSWALEKEKPYASASTTSVQRRSATSVQGRIKSIWFRLFGQLGWEIELL